MTFMFENVAGLLRGKWTKEGEKGESGRYYYERGEVNEREKEDGEERPKGERRKRKRGEYGRRGKKEGRN